MEKDICFDVEVATEHAQRCREWLDSPMGQPFWNYVKREAQRRHDGAVNSLTDNPIRDILLGQREIAAEQALLSLMDKVQDEISLGKVS